tara:strand:- start:2113 stop:2406 length:294 start_codon:yes stop_codon:yes gene_type:complete
MLLFKIFIYIFSIINFNVCSNNITRPFKPRTFTRINKGFVEQRIYFFLVENNINNCYMFLEEHNHLILKCLGDYFLSKQLFEVDIIVKKEFLSNIKR